MYTSLIDAPLGRTLILVKVEDLSMEMRLRRMGLFEGSSLTRLDEEVLIQPVRVRGPGGEFILGGGMASRIVAHLDDGRKLPLVELKPGESGHIEGVTCGGSLEKTLKTLGVRENDEITFVRKIPPMEYITLVEEEKRIRLNEGMAAKIWGRMGEKYLQFASAGVKEKFEVTDILGGQRIKKSLTLQGITPGKTLMLEGVEQAKSLFMTRQNPLIISSSDGLRLFLQEQEGRKVFVRVSEQTPG
ncbi:ferrous iron transport protein A [Desulfonema magnum]|uniref:Ferrous iron transporter FeoA domain-containing protein n=1 Tax=Desulfonema magnum TaxID=45655 RepID=A0A975BK99_9BACT|nr:FeoA family protein [Desulfonema magnum]QTA86990.1 Ferrous iron transporter FeoA domain-containing protein [Desulfonema magnum]